MGSAHVFCVGGCLLRINEWKCSLYDVYVESFFVIFFSFFFLPHLGRALAIGIRHDMRVNLFVSTFC